MVGTVFSPLALAGGREPLPAQPPRPLTAYGQLSAAQGAKFDRIFLATLPAYLEVGQRIANSAFYGSKNPEVKAFAAQTKTTYSVSLAKLKSWGGTQSSIMDIVGPQGGDYDRWFLTSLPAQNEQLRQLLLLVPTHTQNANLRQFAAGLLPKLDAENIHARALLKTLK
ncbi:MAG: hypothetical protein Q4C89_14825 [Deinococcus sp.]|uniref:hypothetical protein n=1 Tax=Deinococcus sp. TaxID=47478 RepID=UPI0026DA87D9|nr:hypothetical protein [Deinococcus sp.]MDO4247291.1 hypothetical protein [Deinococcus sp.]